MLFHVGVVWRLHDAGWLERLDRVSSVSGGSITAGALALAWPRLAAEGLEAAFVAPVRALAGRTVDQSSVIVGALTSDTISERVAKAYREHLFGDATLQDLPDHPRFVINATSVQSGALFRFSKPYMADWRVGRVDQPRRRARRRGRGLLGLPARPLPLRARPARRRPGSTRSGNDLGHGEYRERAVLSDGGVYDNLGLETAWKACRTVLVSDAGGQMAAEPDPDHDWGRHLFRVLGVIDNQVRSLRKRQCVEAFKAGERRGRVLGHPQRHRRLRPRRRAAGPARRDARARDALDPARAARRRRPGAPHQLGLRRLRRRAARARRPRAARAGGLSLSRGRDRRRVSEHDELLRRFLPRLRYDSNEQYFADSPAQWTDNPGNELRRTRRQAARPRARAHARPARRRRTYSDGREVEKGDFIGDPQARLPRAST